MYVEPRIWVPPLRGPAQKVPVGVEHVHPASTAPSFFVNAVTTCVKPSLTVRTVLQACRLPPDDDVPRIGVLEHAHQVHVTPPACFHAKVCAHRIPCAATLRNRALTQLVPLVLMRDLVQHPVVADDVDLVSARTVNAVASE